MYDSGWDEIRNSVCAENWLAGSYEVLRVSNIRVLLGLAFSLDRIPFGTEDTARFQTESGMSAQAQVYLTGQASLEPT